MKKEDVENFIKKEMDKIAKTSGKQKSVPEGQKYDKNMHDASIARVVCLTNKKTK